MAGPSKIGDRGSPPRTTGDTAPKRSSSSSAFPFSQKASDAKSSTTPSAEPFTYPPPTHASYHLPPSPIYNHPITIVPPPAALIDALRFNTSPRIITSPADLDLLYFTKFIDPTCSRQLTRYLLDALPWYRVNYTTKGIDIKTPRYTTVFGKDATPMPWEVYDKWKPRAIPEILLRLMQKGMSLSMTGRHRRGALSPLGLYSSD
jgi:hypothetical protein